MDYRTLHLLMRHNKSFSHEKLRAQDLNDTECMICSYVYGHAAPTQDEVAEALKMDKTTVAKALSALENKAYVMRTPDGEDRRKKRLCITQMGCEKISGLLSMHDQWLTAILCCLSAEEQKQFESYCERLLEAAEKLAAGEQE